MGKIRQDLKRYVRRPEPGRRAWLHYAVRAPMLLLHEGALCIVGHRLAEWLQARRMKSLAFAVSKLVFFVTGNYIHHETRIGPGCKISHASVVIHAREIGAYFECSANITVGQKNPYVSAYPVIGDFVMVGAGARVLADVGDEVVVGANSVVVRSVAAGSVVAGVPARRVGSSGEHMRTYKRLCRPEAEGA